VVGLEVVTQRQFQIADVQGVRVVRAVTSLASRASTSSSRMISSCGFFWLLMRYQLSKVAVWWISAGSRAS
jgi:hypothetical protein